MPQITIYKGCTKILPVELQYDISGSTITCQIRKGRTKFTELIADWEVSMRTDGKDGAFILTMDASVTNAIDSDIGYMDAKRVVGGETLPIFSEPFQVIFRDLVTD